MGGYAQLIVFCARRRDAGDGREFYDIAPSSPVLMWTMDSPPRAERAIGRLWICCEDDARGKPTEGDAFDDLGSDYEDHLDAALDKLAHQERTAKIPSIRAAYCIEHGLPTASPGPDASSSDNGAGKAES